MVRPRSQVRLINGAQKMSRSERQTLSKARVAAQVGTVRARHVFKRYAKSGKQRPWCTNCALPLSASLPCVEVSQAVKQDRIAAMRGTQLQAQVVDRKAAHKARRAVLVVEELARHEAKKNAAQSVSAVVDPQ